MLVFRTTRRRTAAVLVPALMLAGPVLGLTTATSASAATNGKIEVCKSGANGMTGKVFQFRIDGGATLSVTGGSCSGPQTASTGRHTITELPSGSTVVSGITSNHLVSKSLANRKAVVQVLSGADTTVTFTNRTPAARVKVCKQADNSTLVGHSYSFTINGGAAFSVTAGPMGSPNCSSLKWFKAGTNVTVRELADQFSQVSNITVTQPPATNVTTDNGARTAMFTAGSGINVVTYTNSPLPVSGQGTLEICKYASDNFVTGSFTFNVTDAGGANYGPFTVPLGQCTGPITVNHIGVATVTETQRAPYYLDYVYTNPSNRLVDTNVTNGTADVSIVANDETQVNFVNDTNTGVFKVCKSLTASSGALAGHTFTFNVSTPYGNDTISLTATGAGTTTCKQYWEALPLGTQVNVTEQSNDPNAQLVGVSVQPAANDLGSSVGAGANFVVSSSITSAIFTNQAMGYLEICKNMTDSRYNGTPFNFSVSGPVSFNTTVKAGTCSLATQVPTGNYQITEAASANFHLTDVSVNGTSMGTANPVTVTVNYGGVGNETNVVFTNAVNTAQFKICKTTNYPSLVTGNFPFAYGYTVNGTPYSDALSVTVGTCSGLIGPIPVINGDGSPVVVSIGETERVGLQISNISYGGNGQLLTADPTTGTSSFSLGAGINSITYTNDPIPS